MPLDAIPFSHSRGYTLQPLGALPDSDVNHYVFVDLALDDVGAGGYDVTRPLTGHLHEELTTFSHRGSGQQTVQHSPRQAHGHF